jgi:hypothetical protein
VRKSRLSKKNWWRARTAAGVELEKGSVYHLPTPIRNQRRNCQVPDAEHLTRYTSRAHRDEP